MKRKGEIGLVLLALGALAAALWWTQREQPASGPGREEGTRVAVEAAQVTHGPVTDVREFTGTLEPGIAFTVAPKTGGQVERVHVDIGDRVERGQALVELDDDEAQQAVAEAEAELAVARAEAEQAKADARLAQRQLERTQTLAERNLASQSELDTARAEAAAQQSAVTVAHARVQQREAALARARVQLGYTTIHADWPDSDDARVVGERMINAGDTVGANTPLLTVLGITPIKAVITVPESDYAPMQRGQGATISTDAYPNRRFDGTVSRIAPRFARDSRQARVEIRMANRERLLKPGMFATVRITVGRVDDATLIPRDALVRVNERMGVYRVEPGDPTRVRFQPVEIGIRGADKLQVLAPADLEGRVVTLGQQLLEDGSAIVISELAD